MKLDLQEILSEASKQREEFESLLRELIEIPSVSSDPEHESDVHRSADRAAEIIRQFGGSSSIIHSQTNIPFVHGNFFSASSKHPTVSVYNHMDVIPASRETEPWDTEPFVFTKRGDSYFGRGTTDDKGPALTALFSARLAQKMGVPINIQLLWECEEEVGSPNFAEILRKAGKVVKTDSVVVSDTMWLSRKRPTITAGLRGFTGIRLLLETAATDQHSGDVGGAARNPLGELMKVVCEIYDPQTGHINIPGFYKDVIAPTKRELQDFMRSGFTSSWFKKTYKFKSMRSDDSLEIMKRIWAQPTFEIHGVTGGYNGPGLKSIVPPNAEVKASFRLAPGQDPQKVGRMVREFVRKKNPDVKTIIYTGSAAYITQTDGPLADAAKKSIQFAFGLKPVFVREGGSIGSVISMQQILKSPVMFLGLSLPEHGYHAPNENFDWHQASRGMAAFLYYFNELSKLRSTR
ncbi:MAG TPA: M20/M25/M40 family metallo-hydrolase [Acidobacteriota bacterium]|nr:M20/M25/M40 family metallo-hydrolase [Acidobacteriota bacterium]